MARAFGADATKANDIDSLTDALALVLSMEAEANLGMKYKISDSAYEESIQGRVGLLKKILVLVDGGTAKAVLTDLCDAWSDKGAAIDDYVGSEKASGALQATISRFDDGHYDNDYNTYGWGDE